MEQYIILELVFLILLLLQQVLVFLNNIWHEHEIKNVTLKHYILKLFIGLYCPMSPKPIVSVVK